MENEIIESIDVTAIPAAEKHPYIFARFDELSEGGSLILVNDHDPKPLYYQLLSMKGNTFTWRYDQNGPEVWEVRITRLGADAVSETVGALAAADYRKALIFKKYGIDFCCGGKKSVDQACREKGVDMQVIESELQQLGPVVQDEIPAYDEMPEDALIEHIVTKHHAYINTITPDLIFYANKVANRHGAEHPELHRVAQVTDALLQELKSHMAKEEKVLFPYILHLMRPSAENQRYGPFSTIAQPVHMMEMEHEVSGEYLQEIRQLTNDYTLPAEACNSYRVLFDMLKAFEDDLHEHIHLENNILFPKAMTLEQQM